MALLPAQLAVLPPKVASLSANYLSLSAYMALSPQIELMSEEAPISIEVGSINVRNAAINGNSVGINGGKPAPAKDHGWPYSDRSTVELLCVPPYTGSVPRIVQQALSQYRTSRSTRVGRERAVSYTHLTLPTICSV
eukprot:1636782-Rhodomonas_salina.2